MKFATVGLLAHTIQSRILCIMYREAGTGGHAGSTIRGKSAAMKHFSSFLMTLGMLYEECGESVVCDESLLRKFGTYLIENAISDGGKQIMRDTAQQYFSGIVNILKTLHREYEI